MSLAHPEATITECEKGKRNPDVHCTTFNTPIQVNVDELFCPFWSRDCSSVVRATSNSYIIVVTKSHGSI